MKESKGKGINVALFSKMEGRIFTMRGQRVMMDADLAELYGVQTKVLLQAVKRNIVRFPPDFMFQLSKEEAESLRSQFVTSKTGGRGGRRYLPFVFAEHGVAMLSSVLKSETAIQVNIALVRAFVRMREILMEHRELARKVHEHEKRLDGQDEVIISIVEEMRKRRTALPPAKAKRKIGFGKR